jgi:2-haloacid dehalogenase
MKRINTIIFDLGGVLIDWNPKYVYKTIFQDEKDMDWFFQNVCTFEWNEEQDAGRTIAEATDFLVKKHPDQEANIRAYYNRWEEMLGGPIEETVEILRELKRNPELKLYALTNWSAETFPVALNKYEFLHWFDGRVVSGEERIRKPFPELYHRLVNKFSIDPITALYLDDNPRNLVPAKNLGMETIHFQNPEQFRGELSKLGLLS